MSTHVLILVACLAYLAQVIIGAYAARPLIVEALLALALNMGVTLLMYATAARHKDTSIFIPGLEKSTRSGLLGILYMAIFTLVFSWISGVYLWPAFGWGTPTMDWTSVSRLLPTFLFVDAVTLLFKRWRLNRNAGATTTNMEST